MPDPVNSTVATSACSSCTAIGRVYPRCARAYGTAAAVVLGSVVAGAVVVGGTAVVDVTAGAAGTVTVFCGAGIERVTAGTDTVETTRFANCELKRLQATGFFGAGKSTGGVPARAESM